MVRPTLTLNKKEISLDCIRNLKIEIKCEGRME